MAWTAPFLVTVPSMPGRLVTAEWGLIGHHYVGLVSEMLKNDPATFAH